jgi:hypothetical protein
VATYAKQQPSQNPVDFTIDFGDIDETHGLIRNATLPRREGLRIALPERIAALAT